jgi:TolA-binding protein
MGRAEEAYALYQGVLRDYPQYPDKREIYEKLGEVASRLKKQDEAAEYYRLAKEPAEL